MHKIALKNLTEPEFHQYYTRVSDFRPDKRIGKTAKPQRFREKTLRLCSFIYSCLISLPSSFSLTNKTKQSIIRNHS